MKKLFKFVKDEEGIEIVEWALMAGLFAVAVMAGITYLAGGVDLFFRAVADALPEAPIAPAP